ncbi:MAG TPA: hypothetical protein VJT73_04150, partial [Polyangiaceae bacterium]|nr:hypothetical protein [Polyangiaceae bacterium]
SRVILLVTDGEDLEGDPVSVARSAGEEGTTVHVVQIGGRTPERIPEVSPDGKSLGWRKDDDGKLLTTELSAEGEAQLGQVASVAAGKIVRSDKGTTGIDTIAQELKRKMTQELSERVETVYADVYMYPLGAALALLIAEAFLSETSRRKAGRAAVRALGVWLLAIGGCGWSPSRPFEREAPEVKQAVQALDAGDSKSASGLLAKYLETGSCDDGGVSVNEKVRQRPSASFDLGIALFRLGERFGRRFGDEERHGDAGPTPEEEQQKELRNGEIECALRPVLAIAGESDVPIDLRARAHYLAGNLEFLRGGYEEAVRHYDEALKLIPGLVEGGDTVGQDAAWNRAIALFRKEEEKKKDAGSDASSSPDGPRDAAPRDARDERSSSPDGSSDNRDSGDKDPKKDGGRPERPDAGSSEPDAGSDPNAADAAPPPEPPQNPNVNQDERMLDMLESAPTFQQQDAKNKVQGRKFRGAADK